MNSESASTHRGQYLVTSCILGVLAAFAASVAVAAAPAADPALASWQRHNVLVEFHNLPKRYSCDDLWYKFHDVLLHLGASPNMNILAYRCEKGLGAQARSPRVRAEFYAPAVVSNPTAPEMRVDARKIRIVPGEPSSIDSSDCALLRQMLSALPGKVLSYRLACRAPLPAHTPFSVTVQSLLPADGRPLQASSEASGARD